LWVGGLDGIVAFSDFGGYRNIVNTTAALEAARETPPQTALFQKSSSRSGAKPRKRPVSPPLPDRDLSRIEAD
jgi:hypothetical protein